MFELIETIGNLFAIGFWIVSIAAFVVGIIACIYKLLKGSIGAKCLAVIGAILGVVAFAKMYDWTEHIAWCMFVSGFVVCLFTGVLTNGEEEAPNLLHLLFILQVQPDNQKVLKSLLQILQAN